MSNEFGWFLWLDRLSSRLLANVDRLCLKTKTTGREVAPLVPSTACGTYSLWRVRRALNMSFPPREKVAEGRMRGGRGDGVGSLCDGVGSLFRPC